MGDVAVLARSSDIFSGDSELLLSQLLDAQCRQQSCAKQAYTGFGRQLQPFQFEEEEQGWYALEQKKGVSGRKQQQQQQLQARHNKRPVAQSQRRRSNKKFSSWRQESAQAQKLTLQNVTQLRGYVSDTGGSDVQSNFQSETSKISFKSETSVSLLYRSGFDGLEYEDDVPDFQAIMPSMQHAVHI